MDALASTRPDYPMSKLLAMYSIVDPESEGRVLKVKLDRALAALGAQSQRAEQISAERARDILKTAPKAAEAETEERGTMRKQKAASSPQSLESITEGDNENMCNESESEEAPNKQMGDAQPRRHLSFTSCTSDGSSRESSRNRSKSISTQRSAESTAFSAFAAGLMKLFLCHDDTSVSSFGFESASAVDWGCWGDRGHDESPP